MLKLQVANKDITNGVLTVAWCVDKETLKELSDLSIRDPQVVIVVAPAGSNYHVSKEYRKVVPLHDLMTYLEVRTAGPNKIWASISQKTPKRARNAFLSKNGNQYAGEILNYDGDSFSWPNPVLDAEPVEVVVPVGVFAKEPPKWEKAWVNHWFHSKPVDQCDYRRRRILAYTVKPVVTLLDLVARTVLLLLSTLWFSRGMSFKYLVSPLAYSLADACEVFTGGSYAIPYLPEDEAGSNLTAPEIISYFVRKVWKLVLTPIVLAVLWVMHLIHFLTIFLLILAVAFVISSVILFFASGFVGKTIDRIAAWARAEKKEEEAPWYMDKEEMDLITCSPDVQNRTSLQALPAKHRTIRLRFQDLKSRVCRPFSA